jgi:methionine aminopeptidase
VFPRRGARSAPQLIYRCPGTTCISVNDEAMRGVRGPRARMLTDGLVIAIEPIIWSRTRYGTAARDTWPVRSADGSLTALFEHAVMIQADGCEVLTAGSTT